jgi:hypothetical protein
VLSTVTSLTELAQEFLDVSEESLDQTTAGAPDLVYLEAGPLPAFDCCPALFAYVSSLGEDFTSPQAPAGAIGQRFNHGRRNLATLNVVVLRCAAELGQNGMPTAAAKNAVAATVEEDGWALWNGVHRAIRDGRFKDLCSTVYMDIGQAIPEQGGCVGWLMTVRSDIGGWAIEVTT